MALHGLIDLIQTTDEFSYLVGGLRRGHREQLVVGASGSYKPALMAGLHTVVNELQRPLLVITYSPLQAERLWQELSSLAPDTEVLLYPANEVYPHEEVNRNLDLARERIQVMTAAVLKRLAISIAPIQAVVERIVPPQACAQGILHIDMDTRIDTEQIAQHLVDAGYERVEMVEGVGQFSIRGGIIDVFPLVAQRPVRIELFDDEVDSLREFDQSPSAPGENQRGIYLPGHRTSGHLAGSAGHRTAAAVDAGAPGAQVRVQQPVGSCRCPRKAHWGAY